MSDTKFYLVASVLIIAICFVMFVVLGCNGVNMNADYSRLLDRTTAISTEAARRAEVGELSSTEKTRALVLQAETWQKFRAARDGVEK